MVEEVFQRYGVSVDLWKGSDCYPLRGFVQHTATSARRYVLPEYTSLGKLPRGHYLMLLPLQPGIVPDDTLHYGSKWFLVRRVEKVWFGDEELYCWCLCEEEGEADRWGE